jgi:hypothetical protein
MKKNLYFAKEFDVFMADLLKGNLSTKQRDVFFSTLQQDENLKQQFSSLVILMRDLSKKTKESK